MYQASPYAIPYGSFQTPVVPPTVPPNEGPFLYIPINCTWMPLVAGALSQLQLQATWDCDVDTFYKIQGWIANLISLISCEAALTAEQICGIMGEGGDCEMGCCLRFQDGKLQQLSCGEWTDVPGQDAQAGQTINGQPGVGTPQPKAGGCTQVGGMMTNGKPWLLNIPVSDGDTVAVLQSSGAMNVGSGLWYLTTGHQTFAGEDVPLPFTDPSARAPSIAFGSLLLQLGSDYFPLGEAGTVTISGGHSNEQGVLVPNGPLGADMNGQWNYQIQVCNNQLPDWSATFDFTLHPYSDVFSSVYGDWVPGVGYKGRPGTGQTSTIVMEMPCAATNSKTASLTYSDDGTAGPSNQVYVADSGGFITTHNPPDVGTDITLTGSDGHSAVTNFEVAIGLGTAGTDSTFSRLVITGTGTKPAGWPD